MGWNILANGNNQQASPAVGSVKAAVSKALRTAAVAVMIFGSTMVPRKAMAEGGEASDFITLDAAPASQSFLSPALVGGATLAVATFGGSVALAIKKEKKSVEKELEVCHGGRAVKFKRSALVCRFLSGC